MDEISLYCDKPKFRIGVLLNNKLLRWYNIRNTTDLSAAFLDASILVGEKEYPHITWITDFEM